MSASSLVDAKRVMDKAWFLRIWKFQFYGGMGQGNCVVHFHVSWLKRVNPPMPDHGYRYQGEV